MAPTFLGVNPYSKYTQTAEQFIAFALSPAEYQKGISSISYVPGTYSGLAEASSNPSLSWTGSFLTFVQSANIPPTVAAVVPALSSFFGTLIPGFNQQVYNYFTNQTTAESAMNTAAAQWLAYMEQNAVTL